MPLFDSSNSGNSVFRDRSVLTSDSPLDTPVGRNGEVKRIAEAVQPLTRRNPAENLLIYGPAGSGKSSCVKHVFDEIENHSRVKPAFINCWQYNTRSSLLTELLIQLGYPTPRKGKPVDVLLSKLSEWLNKNRGVAVALDEFDQLEDRNKVIYDLLMLNQEVENRLGIILISNQPASQLFMDPRNNSRLSLYTLQFKPYDSERLEEILRSRVEQSFQPGAVPDVVIQRIAEQVADESGDCRKALEMLLRAGRKADREDDTKVEIKHLDEAG